jgi:hypothetical protein
MPSSPIVNMRTRTHTTYKLDPQECLGPGGAPLLAADDYVAFKDRLTAGESSYLYDDLVREVRADGMMGTRMGTFNRNKVLTWLVEWSFIQEDGTRLPLSMESIDSLDPAVFNYLVRICDRHTALMLEQRKDPKDGAANGTASSTRSGPAT